MSRKGTHVETPYVEYMREVVSRLVGEGYDAFTQQQLADEMGVNRTTSFRARLNQLVMEGELVCWSWYTPAGGVGLAYAAPLACQGYESEGG